MTETITAIPIAREIAAALGAGFSATPEVFHEHESGVVLLTTPTGNVFGIQPTGYGRREHFKIYGRYAQGPGYHSFVHSGDHAPDIRVSINKSPAKIAADIRRRFLNEFERVAELARIRCNKAEADHRAKVALYADLAKAAGVAIDLPRAEKERNNEAVVYLNSGGVIRHGRIRVSGHDHVTFEFSTEAEGARAITAAIFGEGGPCAQREGVTYETPENE